MTQKTPKKQTNKTTSVRVVRKFPKKSSKCNSDHTGSTFSGSLWIPVEPSEFPLSGAALYFQVPSQLPLNHEKCT